MTAIRGREEHPPHLRGREEHLPHMRGREEHLPHMHRGRMPPGWDKDLSDEYEWIPLRLPPELNRISASTRLSIEAEYRGWELTRVRLYTDGTRRVLLRRKKNAHRLGIPDQPGL